MKLFFWSVGVLVGLAVGLLISLCDCRADLKGRLPAKDHAGVAQNVGRFINPPTAAGWGNDRMILYFDTDQTWNRDGMDGIGCFCESRGGTWVSQVDGEVCS